MSTCTRGDWAGGMIRATGGMPPLDLAPGNLVTSKEAGRGEAGFGSGDLVGTTPGGGAVVGCPAKPGNRAAAGGSVMPGG